MQIINTDPARGITVVNGSAYFSLGSTLWHQLTMGWFAKETYKYSPPGGGWKDGEMATMNMADWNKDGNWSAARMRLEMALGFGTYEQSIKVGKGSGVVTTFYLSQHDQDKVQEIDFEFSGHCTPPSTPKKPCGTASVWTNVWHDGAQFGEATQLWSAAVNPPPDPLPDSTQGWGFDVYRYMINWEPEFVSWLVDRSGSGNYYQQLRLRDIGKFGYREDQLYPFISFWPGLGWSPDGSKFLNGADATGDCGPSGKCYQAFYFQSLKFTPSSGNQITRIGKPLCAAF